MDEFNLQLNGELDQPQSESNINKDVEALQKKIEHLKIQAEIDPNSVKDIAKQLSNIMNQKIVVDNIQVDVSKSSKSTQEAGRKITDNIANSIKANKASIESAISDLNKNALNGLVSKFNLGSKNADPKISQDVNKLTKELNALAEQAIRTSSDSSWEGIVNKMSELQSILSSVGKVRVDLSSYDEIIKIADYFSGMNIKIPAENVKEVLSSLSLSGIDVLGKKGSIENLKDLNQQLVQLGITFSRGKSNLNGDWESIFSDLGRADLVGVTNNVDQYVKLINELLLAREKMYGSGSLRPASSTDISNVLLEWLENVENTYKKVAVLYDEQQQLQGQLSQSSDNSTDKLVKDEQRKRSEFQETAKELSKLEEYYKKYFEVASNSDKALQQHLDIARKNIIKQLTEYNPAKGIDGNLPLGFTDPTGITQQNLDYYEAMNVELSKLGYTLGEIQWSDSSYSARAKIIPIDENAIKDATEMRNILFGIKNQTENLAKSSTDSADIVIKNEKKKQDAYKQTANSHKQSFTNPDLDITDNEKKIEQFRESLEELGTVDSKYVDKLSGRFEKLGIQIQSINASLSEVAVHEKGEYKGTKEILSTTLRGLDKNGQSITLMESWDLTNHEFVRSLDGVGASFENVSKYITDYQIKLNNLKTKYSNLNMDYSGFEEMLSNFGKGIGTIDDLRLAFNNLENTAKSSVQSLKSQTSSFDPIQQTLNNMRDLPSMLTTLEANMGGIKDKTSIAEISVKDLKKAFNELEKEMKSNDGKVPIDEKWLENYRKLMSDVTSAIKQTESLKKAESAKVTTPVFKIDDLKKNDIAYMSKVYNTIEKQMESINRMAKAKGWNVVDVSGVEEADGKIQKLTLTVRDAEGTLKKFNMQREKLQGSGKAQYGLMQVGDVKIIETASEVQAKLAKKVDEIQLSLNIGDYDVQLKSFETALRKAGIEGTELENKLNGVKTTLNTLRTSATGDNIIPNTVIENARLLDIEIEKISNDIKSIKLDNSLLADDIKVNDTITRLNEQLRKNSAYSIEAKEKIELWIHELEKGDIAVARLKEINSEAKALHHQMASMGKVGKSFWQTLTSGWQKFAEWTIATTSFMDVIYVIKKGATELKELDSILTEISKTSELTKSQLKELGSTAFESASKYGKSASEYLTGVQEMYRAGFDNASEMAELSLLAQAAGDMGAELANNYLIATNAAYDYGASVEELNKVLDSQNFITNNAAVSMKDMADATSEAGSIASQYGVAIDELSALIAVAVSKTRESGSEIGTALKAIFINLQDTTSKPIREAFDAVEISMTKMVNGSKQLKTPIELIKELSDVFNQLEEGSIERANILNDIGGKHHANILSSILSDLNSYNDMLALYSQGMGSAAIEAEKTANNWESAIKRISNSSSDLLQNFMESDFVIGVLNSVNKLIVGVDKLTESFGALTIGLGAGLFAGIRNVG